MEAAKLTAVRRPSFSPCTRLNRSMQRRDTDIALKRRAALSPLEIPKETEPQAAYGLQYQIQVSRIGVNWTTVFTRTNGQGGTENITLAQVVIAQSLPRAVEPGPPKKGPQTIFA